MANCRMRALIPAVLLCAPWQASVAQTPSQILDPTATVQAFWKAVLSMRWADAVEFLDLRELERARRFQLQIARAPRGREYTAADLMRRDPGMPREAAEYEVRRTEKLRRQYPPRMFPHYFGVDSAAQLEKMPLEELAVRWIQAHDPVWLMLEQRRSQKCPPSPSVDSIASTRFPLVYGAVMAGLDTAFVLFRSSWFPLREGDPTMDGPDLQPLRTATLHKLSAGWRIRAIQELLEGSPGFYGMIDCPVRQ